MLRGIIFPVFGNQIREALVQWYEEHRTSPNETFTIHPRIKPEQSFSFGTPRYTFISNRPWLRAQGHGKDIRPDYRIIYGEIKNEGHLKELIRALDEWVFRNLE